MSVEFYVVLLIGTAVIIAVFSMTRGRRGAGRVQIATVAVASFVTGLILDSLFGAFALATLMSAAVLAGIVINHRLRRKGGVGYTRW